jgi:hypothetical protein
MPARQADAVLLVKSPRLRKRLRTSLRPELLVGVRSLQNLTKRKFRRRAILLVLVWRSFVQVLEDNGCTLSASSKW